MLVKNLARKSGKFTDKNSGREIVYDNLVFECEDIVRNPENYVFAQYTPVVVKVKYGDFVSSYKGNLSDLQNKNVTFFFDQDGHYLGHNVK